MRERLELTKKQSYVAIVICVIILYAAMSWAIDSGKIMPHVIAYLAAYYMVYFIIQLFKKRKTHDKTGPARRAKRAH